MARGSLMHAGSSWIEVRMASALFWTSKLEMNAFVKTY